MKLFSLNITRLRVLNAKWRPAFTSLRTVIPPGLAVIHLTALTNGEENPPVRDAQVRPTGLMQIPQRTGKQLGFRTEDLAKTPNNIYAWAKLTNRDARTLYNLDKTLWTAPTYEFWLTVHVMFLLGTSFSILWESANPKTTNKDHIFTLLLNYITTMAKTAHIGAFSYRDMQAYAQHLTNAQRFLKTLDGPDHATAAFGAELTTPSRGSTMTILQTSAT